MSVPHPTLSTLSASQTVSPGGYNISVVRHSDAVKFIEKRTDTLSGDIATISFTNPQNVVSLKMKARKMFPTSLNTYLTGGEDAILTQTAAVTSEVDLSVEHTSGSSIDLNFTGVGEFKYFTVANAMHGNNVTYPLRLKVTKIDQYDDNFTGETTHEYRLSWVALGTAGDANYVASANEFAANERFGVYTMHFLYNNQNSTAAVGRFGLLPNVKTFKVTAPDADTTNLSGSDNFAVEDKCGTFTIAAKTEQSSLRNIVALTKNFVFPKANSFNGDASLENESIFHVRVNPSAYTNNTDTLYQVRNESLTFTGTAATANHNGTTVMTFTSNADANAKAATAQFGRLLGATLGGNAEQTVRHASKVGNVVTIVVQGTDLAGENPTFNLQALQGQEHEITDEVVKVRTFRKMPDAKNAWDAIAIDALPTVKHSVTLVSTMQDTTVSDTEGGVLTVKPPTMLKLDLGKLTTGAGDEQVTYAGTESVAETTNELILSTAALRSSGATIAIDGGNAKVFTITLPVTEKDIDFVDGQKVDLVNNADDPQVVLSHTVLSMTSAYSNTTGGKIITVTSAGGDIPTDIATANYALMGSSANNSVKSAFRNLDGEFDKLQSADETSAKTGVYVNANMMGSHAGSLVITGKETTAKSFKVGSLKNTHGRNVVVSVDKEAAFDTEGNRTSTTITGHDISTLAIGDVISQLGNVNTKATISAVTANTKTLTLSNDYEGHFNVFTDSADAQGGSSQSTNSGDLIKQVGGAFHLLNDTTIILTKQLGVTGSTATGNDAASETDLLAVGNVLKDSNGVQGKIKTITNGLPSADKITIVLEENTGYIDATATPLYKQNNAMQTNEFQFTTLTSDNIATGRTLTQSGKVLDGSITTIVNGGGNGVDNGDGTTTYSVKATVSSYASGKTAFDSSTGITVHNGSVMKDLKYQEITLSGDGSGSDAANSIQHTTNDGHFVKLDDEVNGKEVKAIIYTLTLDSNMSADVAKGAAVTQTDSAGVLTSAVTTSSNTLSVLVNSNGDTKPFRAGTVSVAGADDRTITAVSTKLMVDLGNQIQGGDIVLTRNGAALRTKMLSVTVDTQNTVVAAVGDAATDGTATGTITKVSTNGNNTTYLIRPDAGNNDDFSTDSSMTLNGIAHKSQKITLSDEMRRVHGTTLDVDGVTAANNDYALREGAADTASARVKRVANSKDLFMSNDSLTAAFKAITTVATTTTAASQGGSNKDVVVAAVEDIVVGMKVTGAGIPKDTIVKAINGTTITLSALANNADKAVTVANGQAIKFHDNTLSKNSSNLGYLELDVSTSIDAGIDFPVNGGSAVTITQAGTNATATLEAVSNTDSADADFTKKIVSKLSNTHLTNAFNTTGALSVDTGNGEGSVAVKYQNLVGVPESALEAFSGLNASTLVNEFTSPDTSQLIQQLDADGAVVAEGYLRQYTSTANETCTLRVQLKAGSSDFVTTDNYVLKTQSGALGSTERTHRYVTLKISNDHSSFNVNDKIANAASDETISAHIRSKSANNDNTTTYVAEYTTAASAGDFGDVNIYKVNADADNDLQTFQTIVLDGSGTTPQENEVWQQTTAADTDATGTVVNVTASNIVKLRLHGENAFAASGTDESKTFVNNASQTSATITVNSAASASEAMTLTVAGEGTTHTAAAAVRATKSFTISTPGAHDESFTVTVNNNAITYTVANDGNADDADASATATGIQGVLNTATGGVLNGFSIARDGATITITGLANGNQFSFAVNTAVVNKSDLTSTNSTNTTNGDNGGDASANATASAIRDLLHAKTGSGQALDGYAFSVSNNVITLTGKATGENFTYAGNAALVGKSSLTNTSNVTTTSGSTNTSGLSGGDTIIVNNKTNLFVGMLVSGTGVPAGARLTDIADDSNTVTLSANLTQQAAGSYTFGKAFFKMNSGNYTTTSRAVSSIETKNEVKFGTGDDNVTTDVKPTTADASFELTPNGVEMAYLHAEAIDAVVDHKPSAVDSQKLTATTVVDNTTTLKSKDDIAVDYNGQNSSVVFTKSTSNASTRVVPNSVSDPDFFVFPFNTDGENDGVLGVTTKTYESVETEQDLLFNFAIGSYAKQIAAFRFRVKVECEGSEEFFNVSVQTFSTPDLFLSRYLSEDSSNLSTPVYITNSIDSTDGVNSGKIIDSSNALVNSGNGKKHTKWQIWRTDAAADNDFYDKITTNDADSRFCELNVRLGGGISNYKTSLASESLAVHSFSNTNGSKHILFKHRSEGYDVYGTDGNRLGVDAEIPRLISNADDTSDVIKVGNKTFSINGSTATVIRIRSSVTLTVSGPGQHETEYKLTIAGEECAYTVANDGDANDADAATTAEKLQAVIQAKIDTAGNTLEGFSLNRDGAALTLQGPESGSNFAYNASDSLHPLLTELDNTSPVTTANGVSSNLLKVTFTDGVTVDPTVNDLLDLSVNGQDTQSHSRFKLSDAAGADVSMTTTGPFVVTATPSLGWEHDEADSSHPYKEKVLLLLKDDVDQKTYAVSEVTLGLLIANSTDGSRVALNNSMDGKTIKIFREDITSPATEHQTNGMPLFYASATGGDESFRFHLQIDSIAKTAKQGSATSFSEVADYTYAPDDIFSTLTDLANGSTGADPSLLVTASINVKNTSGSGIGENNTTDEKHVLTYSAVQTFKDVEGDSEFAKQNGVTISDDLQSTVEIIRTAQQIEGFATGSGEEYEAGINVWDTGVPLNTNLATKSLNNTISISYNAKGLPLKVHQNQSNTLLLTTTEVNGTYNWTNIDSTEAAADVKTRTITYGLSNNEATYYRMGERFITATASDQTETANVIVSSYDNGTRTVVLLNGNDSYVAGLALSGDNIVEGTTIQSINGTTMILSQACPDLTNQDTITATTTGTKRFYMTTTGVTADKVTRAYLSSASRVASETRKTGANGQIKVAPGSGITGSVNVLTLTVNDASNVVAGDAISVSGTVNGGPDGDALAVPLYVVSKDGNILTLTSDDDRINSIAAIAADTNVNIFKTYEVITASGHVYQRSNANPALPGDVNGEFITFVTGQQEGGAFGGRSFASNSIQVHVYRSAHFSLADSVTGNTAKSTLKDDNRTLTVPIAASGNDIVVSSSTDLYVGMVVLDTLVGAVKNGAAGITNWSRIFDADTTISAIDGSTLTLSKAPLLRGASTNGKAITFHHRAERTIHASKTGATSTLLKRNRFASDTGLTGVSGATTLTWENTSIANHSEAATAPTLASDTGIISIDGTKVFNGTISDYSKTAILKVTDTNATAAGKTIPYGNGHESCTQIIKVNVIPDASLAITTGHKADINLFDKFFVKESKLFNLTYNYFADAFNTATVTFTNRNTNDAAQNATDKTQTLNGSATSVNLASTAGAIQATTSITIDSAAGPSATPGFTIAGDVSSYTAAAPTRATVDIQFTTGAAENTAVELTIDGELTSFTGIAGESSLSSALKMINALNLKTGSGGAFENYTIVRNGATITITGLASGVQIVTQANDEMARISSSFANTEAVTSSNGNLGGDVDATATATTLFGLLNGKTGNGQPLAGYTFTRNGATINITGLANGDEIVTKGNAVLAALSSGISETNTTTTNGIPANPGLISVEFKASKQSQTSGTEGFLALQEGYVADDHQPLEEQITYKTTVVENTITNSAAFTMDKNVLLTGASGGTTPDYATSEQEVSVTRWHNPSVKQLSSVTAANNKIYNHDTNTQPESQRAVWTFTDDTAKGLGGSTAATTDAYYNIYEFHREGGTEYTHEHSIFSDEGFPKSTLTLKQTNTHEGFATTKVGGDTDAARYASTILTSAPTSSKISDTAHTDLCTLSVDFNCDDLDGKNSPTSVIEYDFVDSLTLKSHPHIRFSHRGADGTAFGDATARNVQLGGNNALEESDIVTGKHSTDEKNVPWLVYTTDMLANGAGFADFLEDGSGTTSIVTDETTVTKTLNGDSNAKILTLNNTTGLAIGDGVTGTGVVGTDINGSAYTTITAISGNNITVAHEQTLTDGDSITVGKHVALDTLKLKVHFNSPLYADDQHKKIILKRQLNDHDGPGGVAMDADGIRLTILRSPEINVVNRNTSTYQLANTETVNILQDGISTSAVHPITNLKSTVTNDDFEAGSGDGSKNDVVLVHPQIGNTGYEKVKGGFWNLLGHGLTQSAYPGFKFSDEYAVSQSGNTFFDQSSTNGKIGFYDKASTSDVLTTKAGTDLGINTPDLVDTDNKLFAIGRNATTNAFEESNAADQSKTLADIDGKGSAFLVLNGKRRTKSDTLTASAITTVRASATIGITETSVHDTNMVPASTELGLTIDGTTVSATTDDASNATLSFTIDQAATASQVFDLNLNPAHGDAATKRIRYTAPAAIRSTADVTIATPAQHAEELTLTIDGEETTVTISNSAIRATADVTLSRAAAHDEALTLTIAGQDTTYTVANSAVKATVAVNISRAAAHGEALTLTIDGEDTTYTVENVAIKAFAGIVINSPAGAGEPLTLTINGEETTYNPNTPDASATATAEAFGALLSGKNGVGGALEGLTFDNDEATLRIFGKTTGEQFTYSANTALESISQATVSDITTTNGDATPDDDSASATAQSLRDALHAKTANGQPFAGYTFAASGSTINITGLASGEQMVYSANALLASMSDATEADITTTNGNANPDDSSSTASATALATALSENNNLNGYEFSASDNTVTITGLTNGDQLVYSANALLAGMSNVTEADITTTNAVVNPDDATTAVTANKIETALSANNNLSNYAFSVSSNVVTLTGLIDGTQMVYSANTTLATRSDVTEADNTTSNGDLGGADAATVAAGLRSAIAAKIGTVRGSTYFQHTVGGSDAEITVTAPTMREASIQFVMNSAGTPLTDYEFDIDGVSGTFTPSEGTKANATITIDFADTVTDKTYTLTINGEACTYTVPNNQNKNKFEVAGGLQSAIDNNNNLNGFTTTSGSGAITITGLSSGAQFTYSANAELALISSATEEDITTINGEGGNGSNASKMATLFSDAFNALSDLSNYVFTKTGTDNSQTIKIVKTSAAVLPNIANSPQIILNSTNLKDVSALTQTSYDTADDTANTNAESNGSTAHGATMVSGAMYPNLQHQANTTLAGISDIADANVNTSNGEKGGATAAEAATLLRNAVQGKIDEEESPLATYAVGGANANVVLTGSTSGAEMTYSGNANLVSSSGLSNVDAITTTNAKNTYTLTAGMLVAFDHANESTDNTVLVTPPQLAYKAGAQPTAASQDSAKFTYKFILSKLLSSDSAHASSTSSEASLKLNILSPLNETVHIADSTAESSYDSNTKANTGFTYVASTNTLTDTTCRCYFYAQDLDTKLLAVYANLESGSTLAGANGSRTLDTSYSNIHSVTSISTDGDNQLFAHGSEGLDGNRKSIYITLANGKHTDFKSATASKEVTTTIKPNGYSNGPLKIMTTMRMTRTELKESLQQGVTNTAANLGDMTTVVTFSGSTWQKVKPDRKANGSEKWDAHGSGTTDIRYGANYTNLTGSALTTKGTTVSPIWLMATLDSSASASDGTDSSNALIFDNVTFNTNANVTAEGASSGWATKYGDKTKETNTIGDLTTYETVFQHYYVDSAKVANLSGPNWTTSSDHELNPTATIADAFKRPMTNAGDTFTPDGSTTTDGVIGGQSVTIATVPNKYTITVTLKKTVPQKITLSSKPSFMRHTDDTTLGGLDSDRARGKIIESSVDGNGNGDTLGVFTKGNTKLGNRIVVFTDLSDLRDPSVPAGNTQLTDRENRFELDTTLTNGVTGITEGVSRYVDQTVRRRFQISEDDNDKVTLKVLLSGPDAFYKKVTTATLKLDKLTNLEVGDFVYQSGLTTVINGTTYRQTFGQIKTINTSLNTIEVDFAGNEIVGSAGDPSSATFMAVNGNEHNGQGARRGFTQPSVDLSSVEHIPFIVSTDSATKLTALRNYVGDPGQFDNSGTTANAGTLVGTFQDYGVTQVTINFRNDAKRRLAINSAMVGSNHSDNHDWAIYAETGGNISEVVPSRSGEQYQGLGEQYSDLLITGVGSSSFTIGENTVDNLTNGEYAHTDLGDVTVSNTFELNKALETSAGFSASHLAGDVYRFTLSTAGKDWRNAISVATANTLDNNNTQAASGTILLQTWDFSIVPGLYVSGANVPKGSVINTVNSANKSFTLVSDGTVTDHSLTNVNIPHNSTLTFSKNLYKTMIGKDSSVLSNSHTTFITRANEDADIVFIFRPVASATSGSNTYVTTDTQIVALLVAGLDKAAHPAPESIPTYALRLGADSNTGEEAKALTMRVVGEGVSYRKLQPYYTMQTVTPKTSTYPHSVLPETVFTREVFFRDVTSSTTAFDVSVSPGGADVSAVSDGTGSGSTTLTLTDATKGVAQAFTKTCSISANTSVTTLSVVKLVSAGDISEATSVDVNAAVPTAANSALNGMTLLRTTADIPVGTTVASEPTSETIELSVPNSGTISAAENQDLYFVRETETGTFVAMVNTVTAGDQVLTLNAANTDVVAGMTVSGPCIAPGTVITAKSGNDLTLSKKTTANYNIETGDAGGRLAFENTVFNNMTMTKAGNITAGTFVSSFTDGNTITMSGNAAGAGEEQVVSFSHIGPGTYVVKTNGVLTDTHVTAFDGNKTITLSSNHSTANGAALTFRSDTQYDNLAASNTVSKFTPEAYIYRSEKHLKTYKLAFTSSTKLLTLSYQQGPDQESWNSASTSNPLMDSHGQAMVMGMRYLVLVCAYKQQTVSPTAAYNGYYIWQGATSQEQPDVNKRGGFLYDTASTSASDNYGMSSNRPIPTSITASGPYRIAIIPSGDSTSFNANGATLSSTGAAFTTSAALASNDNMKEKASTVKRQRMTQLIPHTHTVQFTKAQDGPIYRIQDTPSRIDHSDIVIVVLRESASTASSSLTLGYDRIESGDNIQAYQMRGPLDYEGNSSDVTLDEIMSGTTTIMPRWYVNDGTEVSVVPKHINLSRSSGNIGSSTLTSYTTTKNGQAVTITPDASLFVDANFRQIQFLSHPRSRMSLQYARATSNGSTAAIVPENDSDKTVYNMQEVFRYRPENTLTLEEAESLPTFD